MGRKVFISILGSNDYKECKYDSKKDKYESENVRFVQEATLDFWNAKEWPSDSIAYIFTTTAGARGSYKCNWLDNGHRDRKTKEVIQCEGLDSRMKKMNLPFPYKQIDIKDGVDEEEIWEIFQVIYDLLSEGDEVYFDITHGFRYIPMLVLPLLNYSKFLKNTTTKNISYGNFEGRDENNISPIVNLTSFSDLQDWTKAGSDFIEYGRTSSLQKQIKNADLGMKSPAGFVNELSKIEGLFYAVRGASIYSGKFFKQLKGQLKSVIKKNKFQPLKAILSKVENKFNHFSTEESVNNGFLAADWCYSHGLLQQACTIGQETIISSICKYQNKTYLNLKIREDIGSKLGTAIAFYCGRLEDRGAYANKKEEYEAFFELDFVKELALPYSQLSELRNSYNHAGLVGNHTADLLKDKYPTYFNNCKKVLAKYKIIETEEIYVTEPVESH